MIGVVETVLADAPWTAPLRNPFIRRALHRPPSQPNGHRITHHRPVSIKHEHRKRTICLTLGACGNWRDGTDRHPSILGTAAPPNAILAAEAAD